MNTKPEAIIFDMDGVLVDSEPYWLVAMDKLFRKYGVSLLPEEFQQTTGLRLDQVIDYWFDLKVFRGTNPQSLADEIYTEVLHLVTSESSLMPGVEDVLASINSQDIPLALASSSNYFLINGLVEFFDIKKYFTVIQSAEDFEYGKPHPEVFLAAAKKMEVQNMAKVIVIEDSLNGLLAAKSARMKCVLMPFPAHREKMQFSLADRLIYSLTELKSDWWKSILEK